MNKLRLILTVGLPGSGKTTWARSVVEKNLGKMIIVCRDDIRESFCSDKFTRLREDYVTDVQFFMIEEALSKGLSVIVADTNLNNSYVDKIKSTFSEKASIEFESFKDVPFTVCIERDAKRDKPVGAQVILDMYEKYLKPTPVQQNPNLPATVLFDIDGTLAQMQKRKPYEWGRVGEDAPIQPIINLLNLMSSIYTVVILSGRDAICEKETREWLTTYNISFSALHMRTIGDNRKDDIIKREIFDTHILPNYCVKYVIDDRLQVCRMWHDLGLTLLRVGNPDACF